MTVPGIARRTRRRMAARGLWPLVVLAGCCIAPTYADTTYKWVDEHGQVHYSDTPPVGTRYEIVAAPPHPSAPPTRVQPQIVPAPQPARPASAATAAVEDAAAEDARCVDALYQIDLLTEKRRAFKPGPGGTRVYLADADRPAELERLGRERDESCSDDAQMRRSQQWRAAALMQALSPDCQSAREKLQDMQSPSTRTPDSEIERQRTYVAEHCPGPERTDLWMADWMFTPRRKP